MTADPNSDFNMVTTTSSLMLPILWLPPSFKVDDIGPREGCTRKVLLGVQTTAEPVYGAAVDKDNVLTEGNSLRDPVVIRAQPPAPPAFTRVPFIVAHSYEKRLYIPS